MGVLARSPLVSSALGALLLASTAAAQAEFRVVVLEEGVPAPGIGLRSGDLDEARAQPVLDGLVGSLDPDGELPSKWEGAPVFRAVQDRFRVGYGGGNGFQLLGTLTLSGTPIHLYITEPGLGGGQVDCLVIEGQDEDWLDQQFQALRQRRRNQVKVDAWLTDDRRNRVSAMEEEMLAALAHRLARVEQLDDRGRVRDGILEDALDRFIAGLGSLDLGERDRTRWGPHSTDSLVSEHFVEKVPSMDVNEGGYFYDDADDIANEALGLLAAEVVTWVRYIPKAEAEYQGDTEAMRNDFNRAAAYHVWLGREANREGAQDRGDLQEAADELYERWQPLVQAVRGADAPEGSEVLGGS